MHVKHIYTDNNGGRDYDHHIDLKKTKEVREKKTLNAQHNTSSLSFNKYRQEKRQQSIGLAPIHTVCVCEYIQ